MHDAYAKVVGRDVVERAIPLPIIEVLAVIALHLVIGDDVPEVDANGRRAVAYFIRNVN